MKITLNFFVEVTVEKQDEPQSDREFATEDAASMKPYLQEKIKEAMEGAWQYNAKVCKTKVTTL
jgi:hypothetical protein